VGLHQNNLTLPVAEILASFAYHGISDPHNRDAGSSGTAASR
jgi:hypothetical protein